MKRSQRENDDSGKEAGGYTGYRVSSAHLETVDARTTSAEDFFTRFVQTRKPCVLLNAHTWDADGERWTLAGLRTMAGDLQVEVEVRESAAESFGLGKVKQLCDCHQTFDCDWTLRSST
jgi:hypothetical protein